MYGKIGCEILAKMGCKNETTSSVGVQLAVSHVSMDEPIHDFRYISINQHQAGLWFLESIIFDKSTENRLGCV